MSAFLIWLQFLQSFGEVSLLLYQTWALYQVWMWEFEVNLIEITPVCNQGRGSGAVCDVMALESVWVSFSVDDQLLSFSVEDQKCWRFLKLMIMFTFRSLHCCESTVHVHGRGCIWLSRITMMIGRMTRTADVVCIKSCMLLEITAESISGLQVTYFQPSLLPFIVEWLKLI